MSRPIPVSPEKWGEMVLALAEVTRLRAERIHDLNQIGGLQEENARLKAEVEAHEKRWAESEDLISHYKQQRDEAINDCQCHRLKAEVERLTDCKAGADRLKAEVERLRKAGDAICAAYELGDDFLPPIQAWNAAKEGKPSV